MQSSFMGSLMEMTEKHSDIFYLTADSGEGGLDLMYQRNFPDRCFNFGIAEETMIASAAGLALCGKTPYVYTAAPFLAYRSFEFIRNDVCLQNVPVKIFGSGSGISVSSLGPTHHTTEDIAVLRSLPNLTIFSPATPKQAYESVIEAYSIPGPVYVRLGMNKEREFFADGYMIPSGGLDVMRKGSDAVVLSTGSVLMEVMAAAEILQSEGINLTVLNSFSIKPFDSETFLEYASSVKHVITVEEHNVIGGLGSIAEECLIAAGLSRSLLKIGLNDRFSKGYGKLDTVRRENGLDAATIAECIRKELQ